MDVDWCLSCERKLHDLRPYCSPECLSYAQPSSLRAPPSPPASGTHRIRQWAQAIPPHIPAGAPILPFADLPLPSPSSERSPSPRPRHQPTPKLIERTAASTPLPTLCVSSPAHVKPPHPARPPFHSYSRPNTSTSMSEASTSLTSLLSEPMVATPDEDAPFGANIGALVRSWVHYDRAKGAKEDVVDPGYVIEKVTDYFPPMPQAKKPPSPPSSSKKSKKTTHLPPSPMSRLKLHAKKVVSSRDRDRLTSVRSHMPTPVIFPSCRAAELDWVNGEEEDDNEMIPAPQRQYHPSFHQPEPTCWTRRVSLSSSVSSSDSSVLLIAPKGRDGNRGRTASQAIAT